MRFVFPIALAVLSASYTPPALAQSVVDPAIARAVVKCQQAAGRATRAYMAVKLSGVQKCLDSVFACVQLKPGDGSCAAKATTLCDKQHLRVKQGVAKLRSAFLKACDTPALPYDVLHSSAALDVDGFGATCLRFGIDPAATIGDYVECVVRLANCRAADVVEAAMPRADDLLVSVGYELRAAVCPTPAPTSTAVSSATPTPTIVLPTPTPTVTLTATATPQDTATSLTPTPTPSQTPPPTATPTLAPTPTVTATPAPFNFVFVTSTTHTGNLGGLAGADAVCAARATAAGLPGTYVAWLSTTAVNAIDRLAGARGFVRTDGTPFADEPSELAANQVWNPLHLDELGTDVGAVTVRTGTTKNGTRATDRCSDWTTTSGNARNGRSLGGPALWTEDPTSAESCAQPRRIYCFGVSVNATTLGPEVTAGKIAFITNGTLKPSNATGTGLAGADVMCATEASNAGLPGTYKALLATSTASAISRFTLAAKYVRPDGTLIADGATLAAGGTLASGVWQRPTGVYLASYSDVAWTGATTPSVAGTASSTCGNFASGTGSGTYGRGTLATPVWWADTGTSSCASAAHHVYCLQE